MRSSDFTIFEDPAGYVQMTSLGSAVALSSVPNFVKGALIQAESQNVRWRDDGTDPTASVGNVLAAGATLKYTGDLTAIKFIEVTGSAKLNVNYFK